MPETVRRRRARDELVGTPIQVKTRFDGSWGRGFEIAEVIVTSGQAPSFRVKRVSDGRLLPTLFSVDDVVPAQGPEG